MNALRDPNGFHAAALDERNAIILRQRREIRILRYLNGDSHAARAILESLEAIHRAQPGEDTCPLQRMTELCERMRGRAGEILQKLGEPT